MDNLTGDEESGICVEACNSYLYQTHNAGGLWPQGKIFYKIGIFKQNMSNKSPLLDLVKQAICEWNTANSPHCQFINITDQPSNYYVTFQEIVDQCPHAHVGCWYGKDQIINLPEKYPKGGPNLRMACVLHEMMHCAGFEHEHSRDDRDHHCAIASAAKNDRNFAKDAIPVGQYDYNSLMHYGEVIGMTFKNNELKSLADRFPTFSAGDRAAIKIFYSPRGTHHGEWHKACSPLTCTDKYCGCGSCGPLKGGANCGYWGKTGHWTCCMNETFDSKCETTHSGFWHAQCVGRCSTEICLCKNCGGGCTYKGTKAHWNCCNKETYESECGLGFKKLLP